jgi:hypothetical protein
MQTPPTRWRPHDAGVRMTSEPGSPASHRLHNCGPGVREVFRCPPIGGDLRLDLYRALCRCREVRAAHGGALRPSIPLEDGRSGSGSEMPAAALARIPERSIAAVGVALLEALDGRLPPTRAGADAGRAQPVLRAVIAAVMERGWHTERLGLARHAEVERERWNAKARIGCTPVSVEELAFTLAAFAVYTPPLLLWSRNPTMDWLRVDVYMQLRTAWGAGGSL